MPVDLVTVLIVSVYNVKYANVCMHVYNHVCMFVSHLATKVFIGKLLAMGRVQVIIIIMKGCTQPCISCTPINVM